MRLNPYQPPVSVAIEEPGLWKRLIHSIRRSLRGRRLNFVVEDILTSELVLSGRAFIEYGVVFSAMKGVDDRFFAAMPLAVDDELHRHRNVAEAARVFRQLLAHVDGLDARLSACDLVLSMVPSYQELETELCRVVIPPDAWRPRDQPDELDLQWPEQQ